jgi:hypothetical protein
VIDVGWSLHSGNVLYARIREDPSSCRLIFLAARHGHGISSAVYVVDVDRLEPK